MHRSEKRKNWIMRLAALLACLTLASASATGRLYARYSTGVSFSDGARVAAFCIEETGQLTQTLTLDGMHPGDTREFTVAVTSRSEVAVSYTIAVQNVYQNLPLTFAMLDASGKESKSAAIAPNESDEKTYTLRVTWPAEQNSPEAAGKTDLLVITLNALQVD